MKTIDDLIKAYQLKIRNIRTQIARLEGERDTLQVVIMDLEDLKEEINQENKGE